MGAEQESSAASAAVFPCGRAESIAAGSEAEGLPFGKWDESALENSAAAANSHADLKRRLTITVFALVLVALLRCRATGAEAGASSGLAARVVVLANSDDPDSLRIARHYAEVRGVPAANLVALKMPLTETISWREFLATIWEPLLAQLVRGGWIDAIPMGTTDAIGRRKYSVHGTRIAALVTCRGVPLKIAHDPELVAESLPFTSRPEFRTNAGAVDSELSMLAFPNYPINAFVPNPLFQNEHPSVFEFVQIVKVARLDGPTADDALALVDRAVAAERTGLLGRAYVDIARRDEVGDAWLESVATQLAALDFDPAVDRAAATIAATARFDAPVLYFGWYAGDLDGPMALPGFRFPPGAIALHIHSFSASTLRQANRGWAGPLVARGVTATVGNVFEPYLQFTHRPNLFLRALARGATLVDAAYFSLQVLSWQAIVIGDPLYRPFAVSLDEQLKDISRLPPRLAGYAVLRRMHELDNAHRGPEATALAISTQRQAPSVALALALAQRFRAAGDNEGAANALGFVAVLEGLRPDEWALVREALLLLESCGRPARAVEGWRVLLAEKALPAELRIPWLRDAARTARAANELDQADAWEKLAESSAAKEKQ